MSDVLEPPANVVERLPAPVRPSAPASSAPATAPPAAPAPEADPSVMSLVDHLAELRKRLFLSVLAIVLGGVVGFIVAPDIIRILADPLPERDGAPYVIQFITLSGSFFNYFKVSLIVGVLIALPFLIYQLWAFVSPGLTEKERRAALPWIPAAVCFFLMGTIVAYVTLPYAVEFLTSWTIEDVTAVVPTGEAYYGFVTMIFLLFGAVMEFPIVLVLLHKLGILSVDKLKQSRRIVLLGVTVFAVVATPGGDPISPMVMAGTMYALYEGTIWALARSEKRREASA